MVKKKRYVMFVKGITEKYVITVVELILINVGYAMVIKQLVALAMEQERFNN